MTNPVFNWVAWINQPLWVLAIAQAALLAVCLLLGNWLALGAIRQEIADAEQQIGEQSRAIGKIRRQLAAMPTLADMQTELAARAADKTPFHMDSAAQWGTGPLSQSGAMLLSWRPALQSAPLTSEGNAWKLAFASDYQGLLNLIRQFISLPDVVRLDKLVVKSTENSAYADRALHIEMTVMRPTVTRSNGSE